MGNKSKAEENSGQNRTRSQMWGKGDGGSPLEMHAKHPGLLPQSHPLRLWEKHHTRRPHHHLSNERK